MAEYHFNEGAFELPATGVIDRSTTAFEVQIEENKRVSVVVTRQLRGDLTLDEIVRDSMKLFDVSLRRFKHSPPRAFDLQGAPAVGFEMTWVHETGPMFHEVAIIQLDAVALTLTVAGTEDLRPHVERVFKMASSTLKIRRKR